MIGGKVIAAAKQGAKLAPYLIVLAGLGMFLLSVGVDLVGLGGAPGFGGRQIKLAALGIIVLLVGAAFIPPVKHKLVFRWLMPATPYPQPTLSPLRRVWPVLLSAIWFGLLIGYSDLYEFTDQLFLRHDVFRFSTHVVWMSPLAGIVLCGIPALVLSGLSWRWPQLSSIRVLVTVFGFLLFLTLVVIFLARVQYLATLVLTLGLALVSARIIGANPDRFYGLVRRTVLPLLLGVVVITSTFLGSAWWTEHQALAALPAARPGAPNVILITLDTVRASDLSLYGYARPTTPNLENLAKQSVTFDYAISPSPWTLPSHSSMFTGRWPHELSADFYVPLDNEYPTLAEVLYSRGYETAGFTANNIYGVRYFGLNRGMVHYEDIPIFSPWEIMRSSKAVRRFFHQDLLGQFTGEFRSHNRKSGQSLNSDFLRWLENRDRPNRPFFAFLNYFNAHDPYSTTPKYALEFSGKEHPLNAWLEPKGMPPGEVIRELNDTYDGSIAYLDEQIALLMTELEQRGLRENTLLIVTSDHGEHFGEHRILGHANSLYIPLLHVPLLISFPGHVPTNVRVSAPVTLRDLPATISELVNLNNDGIFPGESLSQYWKTSPGAEPSSPELILSEVSGRDWILEWHPAYKGDMKSLVSEGKLYIKNADGKEELYDLTDEPADNDLIGHAENISLLKSFRETMNTLPAEASYRPTQSEQLGTVISDPVP